MTAGHHADPLEVGIASTGWGENGQLVSMRTHPEAILRAVREAGGTAHCVKVPGLRSSSFYRDYYVRELKRATGIGDIQVWMDGSNDEDAMHATSFDAMPPPCLQRPRILTVHDFGAWYEIGVGYALRRHLVLKAIRAADRVIVTTWKVSDEMERFAPWAEWKTSVIPVPYEPSGPKVEPEFDVIWVGGDSPSKRLETFIRAAEKAGVNSHKAIRFGIRVSGATKPFRRGWEGYVPGRDDHFLDPFHKWTIWEREVDVDELYRRSKVIVSTSQPWREGFHAPIVEAYLNGVRVVVPTAPPYTDHFGQDGMPGVHYYVEDSEIPAKIREAVEAGPFTVPEAMREKYSYRVVGRQLLKVYESAMEGPGA